MLDDLRHLRATVLEMSLFDVLVLLAQAVAVALLTGVCIALLFVVFSL